MNALGRIRQNPQLLLKGIKDIPVVLLELNRLYYNRSDQNYNPEGIDIFEQEWDNLIILDACRYDYYKEIVDIDGELHQVESRGTTSSEFVKANFSNKSLHDVVYVSGNRWFLQLRDQLNCEIHAHRDVERDFYVERGPTGDDETGYVPYPETVMEAALEALDNFPEKRLIIHLMQPHKPYLGPHSDQFTYEGGLRRTMEFSDADTETLRDAYLDTLRISLDTVAAKLDELDGRTIITADHGELLGEKVSPFPVQWYGHPKGIYVPELVEIPWHVVKKGPRRLISEDPPEEQSDIDEEDVADTLRALGYLS